MWSGREDLNLRPPAPHAGTLPGCATPRRRLDYTTAGVYAAERSGAQRVEQADQFFAQLCDRHSFAHRRSTRRARLIRHLVKAIAGAADGKTLIVQQLAYATNQQDFVVELLAKAKMPLTRDNYLGLAYPDGVPKDLDETSLPPEIRQA